MLLAPARGRLPDGRGHAFRFPDSPAGALINDRQLTPSPAAAMTRLMAATLAVGRSASGRVMSAADLISLASLVVAVVAFVLSYRAQQRTQASTDEQNLNDLQQDLNDLIEKIQAALASVGQPQATLKLESIAAENAALVSLQGLALEARRLARIPGITLDWFQNMVLAMALSQAWDLASAGEFWDGAVTAATEARSSLARIQSLTSRATFFYKRGLNHDGHHDWQDGRNDYRDALAELHRDPDGQGPDLVAEQTAFIKLYQAGLEFDIANDSTAIGLAADAFIAANSINAPWRRISALDRLGYLTQAMQTQVTPPRPVLPEVAAELTERKKLDDFPSKTRELLLMPADGSQLSAGLYGQSS
jgi:hypothetical protein